MGVCCSEGSWGVGNAGRDVWGAVPCAHREQLLPSPASPLLSLLGSALGISLLWIYPVFVQWGSPPCSGSALSSLVSLNLLPFSLQESCRLPGCPWNLTPC